MITFLIGAVSQTTFETACINVHGVGYEVLCPGRVLAQLTHGQDVKLLTHHHMREDGQALYGFLEEADRAVFRHLISISGVGPKAALAILSSFTAAQVADAVAIQSGKTLAQAHGIGAKTGERIVRELKDKLGAIPLGVRGVVSAQPVGGTAADVLSALLNLGYREHDAQPAVAKVFQDAPDLGFDVAFKQTLQQLRG